jgi:hypothetical protein
MRVKYVCLGCLLLLVLSAFVAADTLRALQGQVLRLTELEQTEYRARQEWQSQKQLLQDQLAIMQKQSASLTAALTEQGQANDQRSAGNGALATELASLRTRLQEMSSQVQAHSVELLALQVRLPAELRRHLQAALARLEGWVQEAPAYEELPAALQTHLSLLTEIEQYDHGLHLAKEVLIDHNGQRRECEVLYLGLAMAYALTANGAQAALGVPMAYGWQWQWQDEWAPAFRQAMAVARKDEPARLLRLPVPPITPAEAQP